MVQVIQVLCLLLVGFIAVWVFIDCLKIYKQETDRNKKQTEMYEMICNYITAKYNEEINK